MTTNSKAILGRLPDVQTPADGYLLSYNAASNLWIPINVPLGINRQVHPTVNSTPFAVQQTDDFIPVDVSITAITVNLPAGPALGKGYTIAHVAGNAAANNITVNGNGHNILGAGTFVINTNFQTLTVVFDGTNWSKV
jgi:hypothetical protein